jgi:hypothetical protein
MMDIERLILLITLCVAFVLFVCVFSLTFLINALKKNAKKPRKRKRSTANMPFNNEHSEYVCRHAHCFRAPEAEDDNYVAQNLQNRNRHECAVLENHNRCISNDCGFCLQLLGMPLREYRSLVVVGELKHDRDALMLKLNQIDSSKNRKILKSSPPFTTPRRSSRTNSRSSTQTSYDYVSTPFTRSSSSTSSTPMSAAFSNLSAASATRSGGRREHALKQQLGDSYEVLQSLSAFLNELPPVSPFRWQIIGNMARYSSVKKIEKIFSIPYHRVYNAMCKVADDLDESIRWPKLPYLRREHWRDEVIVEARKHWYECARQTTRRDDEGNRIDLYYHDLSQDDIFLSYRAVMANRHANLNTNESSIDGFVDIEEVFENLKKEKKVLGRTSFIMLKPSNISYGRIRECSCGKCRIGWEVLAEVENWQRAVHAQCEKENKNHELRNCEAWLALKSNEEGERYEAIQLACAKVEAMQQHRARVKAQRECYERDLCNLLKDEVLLLFDFSPYPKGYNRNRTMSEAMGGVQCLHVCAYIGTQAAAREKKEDNQNNLFYFDFFAHDNNDYYFFRRAMLELVSHETFNDKVVKCFWSDGGPKHFKTKRSLCFALIELPLLKNWKVMPIWHFYEANHGKSLCDAHASHIKSYFRREAIMGRSFAGAKQYVEMIRQRPKKNEEEKKALFRQNKPEARPIFATAFETFVKDFEYDWSDLEAIRCYHWWQYSNKMEKLKNGKTKYVLHVKNMSNDSKTFQMEVQAKYDFNDKMDGTELDAIVKKNDKKEKTKLKSKEKKKKNAKVVDDESDSDFDFDDENCSENDDIVSEGYVTVPFTSTKECIEVPKPNMRVAVKFIVNGVGEGEYFSGTVLQVGKRYICKKIGKEEFLSTLRVLFDGLDENPLGEVVDFNEDVRLL